MFSRAALPSVADRASRSTGSADRDRTMTDPYYDSWRHQRSAAPHDRTTLGLPLETEKPTSDAPTPSDPAPTRRAQYTQPASGLAHDPGILVAEVLFLLVFAGPLFGTLYPLAAGAALATGLVTNGMLRVEAPGLGADGRLPVALLAGAVVFWWASRLDHRFADRVRAYRAVRHVVRVLLLAIALTFWTFGRGGGDPTGVLPVVLLSAVAAHLALTRAHRFREHWHYLLELARLRPS